MVLESKYLLVDETGLDRPKVDETAVDEIAVDEPGPNQLPNDFCDQKKNNLTRVLEKPRLHYSRHSHHPVLVAADVGEVGNNCTTTSANKLKLAKYGRRDTYIESLYNYCTLCWFAVLCLEQLGNHSFFNSLVSFSEPCRKGRS